MNASTRDAERWTAALADPNWQPRRSHLEGARNDLARAGAEIERLTGALRYIATQAKANHPGALAVIIANAEGALDGSTRRMQAAALSTGD